MISSHVTFIWICTAIVVCTCASWIIMDMARLARLHREPVVEHQDRVFGYIIGIGLGILGLIGIVRYHW